MIILFNEIVHQGWTGVIFYLFYPFFHLSWHGSAIRRMMQQGFELLQMVYQEYKV